MPRPATVVSAMGEPTYFRRRRPKLADIATLALFVLAVGCVVALLLAAAAGGAVALDRLNR